MVEKAWKKIESGGKLIDWDKRGKKPIEGLYLGFTENKGKKTDKKGKGKSDTYKIFRVQTEKEGTLAFSGKNLEQQFENIKPKTHVKVIFTGKVKTSAGYKVNTFEVWVR